MSDTTLSMAAPRALPFGRRGWFLGTIFTSAFLLFLVQPMVARMALPRVGGAPSVWNSAMLVYQALLLGGYAYADALGRLAPRVQARLHLALLAAAALTLPIGLMDWTPPVDGNIFLWVPWLFLASIGPLFFVMSAHAPLLQRWYAASGCGDPYPLYAASNIGSFLGLIAYPLLVEPAVGVEVQSKAWSAGFLILILLVAGASARLPASAAARAEPPSSPAPAWRTMARWALLAAIPSGLIMSTTLHLTTDIVAMPLLWVLPLGLYLLSFSVAFAEKRSAAAACTRAAPIALLLCACGVAADSVPLPWVMLVASLGGLFLLSVALHARLYDERPAPDRLTRFYLVMSTGGALGGLFCALIAPLVFDWTYEHPILLVAAAFLLPALNPFAALRRAWAEQRPVMSNLLLLGLLAALAGAMFLGRTPGVEIGAMILAALCGVLAIGQKRQFALAVAVVMLVGGGLAKLALSAEPGKMTRSFFGIYSVQDGPNHSRRLVHGTTAHGTQNLGSPERERMATAYYAPRSGIGEAMAWTATNPRARVSVVGLGAGTLACYARPGQQWRFYEIDPAIDEVARDPARFTFLSRCLPAVPTVIGDARLTLERAAPASADVLVIDAFSSDSIPMHLLTREAFRLYRDRLAPGGLLMVHISNRYLDLEPVIAAAAADGGWTAMIRRYQPTRAELADNAGASHWVALAQDPATLAAVRAKGAAGDWSTLESRRGFIPWTDSRSTILPLIKW